MTEEEIKEMHEHARQLLQEEKSPYVNASHTCFEPKE